MIDNNDLIKLNNGVHMPKISMGTYPMNGLTLVKAALAGIYHGFRCIDSAYDYGNEKWLGLSIKVAPINRKKLFITSKLGNEQQVRGNIEAELNGSLKRIGIKYLDLYLMHWPYPGKFVDSWLKMEQLYRQGKVKAIGVCNFDQHHIEKLMEKATITPMINQIEIHPLRRQKALIEYCQSMGIAVQAYCPLALMNEKLMNNSILIEIARKYKKTIPQIILRWHIQLGVIPIPKSATPSRLKENVNIFNFQLTEEEMKAIDSLNENLKVYDESKYCPQSE